MSEANRDSVRSARRIEWVVIVILTLPAVALIGWYLASNAQMSLPDGDYSCLDLESQRRLETSEQLGTPMIYDPRPGSEWVGTVNNGDLVRVHDFFVDLKTLEPATLEADSFTMGEVINDGQFAATINGSPYTCTE